MKNRLFQELGLWVIIMVGLVTAQLLMDVPSSGGDMLVLIKHSAGICLAFFVGVFYRWAQE